MSANTILVFSEKPALLAELLGQARRQADQAHWTVAALALDGEAATLGAWGADVVYQIPAGEHSPEAVLEALTAAARRAEAGVCLVGATKLGMETAPRLAERLAAGYAAWITGFELGPQVTARSMLFAGAGQAAYQFKPGPVVLTAASGVFAPQPQAGKAGAVTPLELPALTPQVTVLETKPKPSGGAGLEQAKLVLDVGQGVKQRDDLRMVQELADLLDGQLACSRPIASDRDWFPEWLGLSGAKVKPELCLVVGVSGAIQHIIGIRDSHLIAAVNNDENAPIFNQADYGVVADLYEFLPLFTQRVRERRLRPAWKA